MNTVLAQLETAIKAIDHAATQGIYWLLLASLVVIGVFAWMVIRWLVKKDDARTERDEAVAETRMKNLIENTIALREVREVMDRVIKRLDK